MDRWVDAIARFVVRRRWIVLLTCLGLTAVSVNGYYRPEFFAELLKDFQPEDEESPSGSSDAVELPDVSPLSLGNSDVVIVVESDDFFTPDAVTGMREAVEALEALDQVNSVLWMDQVPILNIFGLPEPLLPRATATPAKFESSRRKAQEHPLVGGQLLSNDTHTQLLMVELDYHYVFNDESVTQQLRSVMEEKLTEFDKSMRVRTTGRVPLAIAAIQTHEANQLKYQIIGYGMIVLMSLILFRGIRAVIIVALAPACGVFWTLGIVRYLGFDSNPLVDVIVPILVSLVGLTDGVHLMVQIRKLRASGMDKTEAAYQGLRKVGLACFLTSLTTAIGFGSLGLAGSVWVREFGFASMFGVSLCFLAVLLVIPLACSSRLGNRIEIGLESSVIDRNLSKVGILVTLVLRFKRLFAAAGVLLTCLFVAQSLTLRPDQRESDGLPPAAEATKALQHVDKAFGGLEFSRCDVRWSPKVDSNSPEILRVITKVDELLKQEELIGNPLSIRNLIDAQPGSGPPEERMSLLDLLPPPLKRAFFTPEYREAEVTFRVQDLGIATYGPVFQRLEAEFVKVMEEHPEFEVELAGRAVNRWKNLYQIVVDLASSLGTAIVIIWIVLTVVFRSLRLGLISLVPNLFPLALTGTYLALSGYNLEIVMVCNFTVCLGIAVDDTIHFMTRYIDERKEQESGEEAIRRAFTGVGTALIMTTTVLVVGFAVVIFSDSRDHHIFGVMGAITVAAALFCDLIFLPALLAVFDRSPEDT